ncbi:MAG: hypothetical protein WCE52_10550, partial [Candidatus Acidiferrum sp.]
YGTVTSVAETRQACERWKTWKNDRNLKSFSVPRIIFCDQVLSHEVSRSTLIPQQCAVAQVHPCIEVNVFRRS